MNIRLGIYEIFSRIVPGLLYIAAVGQVFVILGLVEINWEIVNNISITSAVGIIIIAYFVGEAFDRFAIFWFRLFRKKGFSTRSFAAFKKKHIDQWTIDFEDRDWPILLAHIRTKNLELASEIERHNALSIMLRNVSFGFLLMAISSQIQYILSRDFLYMAVSISLLVIAVLLGRESGKFREWFYNGIYETIIALRIELTNYVKPVENKTEEQKNGDR